MQSTRTNTRRTTIIFTELQSLWTNNELTLGASFGICFACIGQALGGIDASIEALAVLMVLDVITGISASIRKKRLSSSIGAKGLFKKAGIFLCILIGFMLDTAMHLDIFRNMVIAGFALIEGISLIENIDRMGFGYVIPKFLRSKIKQIAEEKEIKKTRKGDKKNEERN